MAMNINLILRIFTVLYFNTCILSYSKFSLLKSKKYLFYVKKVVTYNCTALGFLPKLQCNIDVSTFFLKF